MAPVPGPHEFRRRLFEPFREAEMALHYLVPGLFRVAWNRHSADQIVHFQEKTGFNSKIIELYGKNPTGV
jgi:hypothetical protein